MQHGIRFEDLLKVGVVGCETMVGAGRLGEQETHWISFVSERRLNTNKDVSELLSVYYKVLSIGVEISWCWSPVLLELSGVRR